MLAAASLLRCDPPTPIPTPAHTPCGTVSTSVLQAGPRVGLPCWSPSWAPTQRHGAVSVHPKCSGCKSACDEHALRRRGPQQHQQQHIAGDACSTTGGWPGEAWACPKRGPQRPGTDGRDECIQAPCGERRHQRLPAPRRMRRRRRWRSVRRRRTLRPVGRKAARVWRCTGDIYDTVFDLYELIYSNLC